MKFHEAFRMAATAIRTNKLRSFLTLVGIIAGIASVIAVMTGISVVQGAMEEELSVLGTTTFQVQKWPRGNFNGDDIDWRKIQLRKPITVGNSAAVREHADLVDAVGSELWQFGSAASYRGEQTNGRLWVVGGDPSYPANNTHYVEFGRNLSWEDVAVGRRVAVIGFAVAEELFPFIDPIDKIIKVDGRKYRVVGVFGEKKTAMGGNFDNYIMIPVTRFQRAYGLYRGDELRSVNMTINAKSPEVLEDAIAQVRGVLRADRGVSPRDDDDFYLFTNDSQIKAFNEATAGVKLGAFVIGTIALIVAGIGIMNIMLVSVTERTKEIGIRKALGARRRDILWQFLLEAILLCNVGGVLGVIVGFGLGNIVIFFTEFAVSVPMDWAVRGVVFCTVVGLTFGLWPAMKASKLPPIEALGYE